MPLVDTTWYTNAGDQSTTGYFAVAKRPQNASVAAGQLVRQFTAPAVGSERCFVCIVAGTTANTTDATWVLTRGAKTTDGTATWMECTGQAALNGDLTNTATWAQVKAATPAVLGQIIKRSNNASYQICTTAGAMSASEPAFSNTAGVTTTDTTAVWTSLGVVGNFTGGQAPHARLANACVSTWFAAGNTVYVADNHAESQTTSITITPALTVNTVGKIFCHNHSGSYPPAAGDLTFGATISTTAASTNISLTWSGASGGLNYSGLAFKPGVGQSNACNANIVLGGATFYFDLCSFELASTGATAIIFVSSGGSAGVVTFNNTTVKFANVGQSVTVGQSQFIWQNTGAVLVSGSSVPTTLLAPLAGTMSSILLEALDLSQLTGAVLGAGSATSYGNALIKDCKLNASATISTPQGFGITYQLVRCDSGATGYKSARYAYEGTETTETSITRVGGAVDPTGQAQSRKIVTTANSQWLRPFRAEPYAQWNAVTGTNRVVTVCGTINAGALPNNDDIWLEVEYLGSSATPLGTIVTTTKASVLAANAAVASDSSSWNGGGSGAGWSPFKLVATLSSPQPAMAGYLHARVRAAKASTTWYIDPQITLS
jgi:hypothetical protein